DIASGRRLLVLRDVDVRTIIERGNPVGDPHGIGIIGIGVISGQYFETLAKHPDVRIVATADLDPTRAAAGAQQVPGCHALTADELLADPAVDTVLNLTVPAAHAPVALAALGRGKNVYGE